MGVCPEGYSKCSSCVCVLSPLPPPRALPTWCCWRCWLQGEEHPGPAPDYEETAYKWVCHLGSVPTWPHLVQVVLSSPPAVHTWHHLVAVGICTPGVMASPHHFHCADSTCCLGDASLTGLQQADGAEAAASQAPCCPPARPEVSGGRRGRCAQHSLALSGTATWVGV